MRRTLLSILLVIVIFILIDSDGVNHPQLLEDIVLTPMCFRCCRVVGPGKDYVPISIPVSLSCGLSP